MKTEIYQRIYSETQRVVRDQRTGQLRVVTEKRPVGLLYAEQKEGKVYIGYSSLNPLDKFDMAFGLKLAKEHTFTVAELQHSLAQNSPPIVPTTVRYAFPEFLDRAKRYFKTGTF